MIIASPSFRRLATVCATIALSGCATIVHGRFEQLNVASDPSGAAVTVNCGVTESATVVTPATVKLRRKAEACSLSIRKDGYEPQEVHLSRKTSAAIWWNVAPGVLGGVMAGMAVGPSSLLCEANCNNNASNNAALAGLAVVTGIPMVIDHATGAMYRHSPGEMHVMLKPVR